MNEKNPEIKISFTLEGPSGKTIDLNELTECLAIRPTETRTLNDWPNAIKHPKIQLPDDLKPRCCWTVELNYKDCLAVRDQFEEMIHVLRDKVDIINLLKEKNNLKTNFVVVISAYHDRMPELFLTKENIKFIASIGAELGFDMYLD